MQRLAASFAVLLAICASSVPTCEESHLGQPCAREADEEGLSLLQRKPVTRRPNTNGHLGKDAWLRISALEAYRAEQNVGIDWDKQNKLPPWMSNIAEGSEEAIAIVLGQSLKPDGTPSQVLLDRAEIAKELLDNRIVSKVVVSGGDPAGVGHTEASEAKKVLMSTGIASEDIILESQATTTAENAWFTLRWIPPGTGRLYIVTSDFHMARATYIFEETFNFFYKEMEDSYRDDPRWNTTSKKYPRLSLMQAPSRSFCGGNASLNRDSDPNADINLQSLSLRARNELKFLGSGEVPEAMWGEPLNEVMYIWPVQINVTKDPENRENYQRAMAQSMNVASALCGCMSPPAKSVPALSTNLKFPIETSFPEGMNATDWESIYKSC